ncbi:MAG TPA: hypothetical protein PLV42_04775 [bacterium]|nr:hypothetical protein [bacterium]
MIFMGMIVFLTSLASAAVGWFTLGHLPGALIGFFAFFLPGLYFMYQNLKAEPEKPHQNDDKKNAT